MLRAAVDFETFLIGPDAVTPDPICYVISARDDQGKIVSVVRSMWDEDPWGPIERLLRADNIRTCWLNAAFDLRVIAKARPDLEPLIWEALVTGRVSDIGIRQRLLNLSTHGRLTTLYLPDGSSHPILYNLGELAKDYLGKDRTEEKKSNDDEAVRMHFEEMAGRLASEYDRMFYDYVVEDGEDTLRIHELQDKFRQSEEGPGSFKVEHVKALVDYALAVATETGIAVDHDERQRVEAMLRDELDEAKLDLVIQQGIIRPADPGRPHARQLNRAAEILGREPGEEGWGPYREQLEAQGISFTKPKKSSKNTTLLKDRVVRLCKALDEPIKRTPTGGVSCDAEVLERLRGVDPVMDQFIHRQTLIGLLDRDMAAMFDADGQPVDRMHFNFNVVVETGRTSSSGGKKPLLYPARNGQNVDPRIRPCFVPDPGWLLYSCDYAGLELVTFAQTCIWLFGASRMAEIINQGINVHEYMGAQLARYMHQEFRTLLDDAGITDDPMKVYETFHVAKTHESEATRAFWKKWRTFAKPTNLGYPGGLGPRKMVSYAKSTYGIDITVEEAEMFRQVWYSTFPEAPAYFDYVNEELRDPVNEAWVDEDGELHEKYCYRTRLGMYRAGATYCAAANGLALQSPGAEGATLGYASVVRAVRDRSQESVLYGTKVHDFIHDEVLGSFPENELVQPRAQEVQRLMEEALQAYTPDVRVSTEMALMRAWRKEAEEVRDEGGRLQVWTPAL